MKDSKYKKPGGTLILLVGGSDTGKSTTLKKTFIEPGIKNRKSFVIVDTMGEYEKDYPNLSFYNPAEEFLKEEGYLDKERARLLFRKMRGEYSTGKYDGKIVIWEEASQMLTPMETGSSQAVLQMTNLIKHRGCILIFVYQSFRQIPEDLIRFSDLVIMKKTFNENLPRLEKVLNRDEYEDFWSSYKFVNESEKMWETATVQMRQQIIRKKSAK